MPWSIGTYLKTSRITIISLGILLLLLPTALYYSLLDMVQDAHMGELYPWRSLIIAGGIVGSYLIAYGLGLISPVFRLRRNTIDQRGSLEVGSLMIKADAVASDIGILMKLFGGIFILISAYQMLIGIAMLGSHEFVAHGLMGTLIMALYFSVAGLLTLIMGFSLAKVRSSRNPS